ncbi:MAG: alpha-glucosidase [Anaerocolumna sp.]
MEQKQWWKEAVVYQIYPRSFKDSNGDGIGDIPGIIEKLDYLKYLGIDIIWISPMYQSPNDDNGYDISDYKAIMNDFGTMGDFNDLLEKAHGMGMKIIMDLVVNHTSDEHKWFVESRKSKDNPYRDFYIWREGKAGKTPNNWGSWFGGSAWKYDKIIEMYYLHIFSEKQADLNWDNPKVRDEIFDMMTWWLDKGIDGFRMDVISLISKTPEFPDGEVKSGLYGDLAPYCIHGPRVHEYLQEMNQRVLSKYDIMTVGEATGVTLEEAGKYAGYDSGELNTVFQFEHMELDAGAYGKWSNHRFKLTDLKEIMTKWQKALEGKCWNCLFWSNHDQPRAVSRFGNDKEYRELSAKMLGTCLHMMRGTPYIYQGEELGMNNANFKTLEEYRDIESINAYEEYINQRGIAPEIMMEYLGHISRDNARTPMQWDNSKHAGFTSGTPWISVNKNYEFVNAQNQIEDKNSVYHYYKKLIQLRHENEIIIYGTYELLLPENEQLYVYTRKLEAISLLVICNFTNEIVKFQIPELFPKYKIELLISNYPNDEKEKIRAFEAKVYMINI